MIKKSLKSLSQITLCKLFLGTLLFALISACSKDVPRNIESYVGLYEVVDSKCEIKEDTYNPCKNTHFIELVKGQFIGTKDAEIAYVFWSGDLKIDPELQYASHTIANHTEQRITNDKFWLNNSSDTEEYFGFSEGSLTSYFVKYTTGNKGDTRIIEYNLRPVIRSNLPHVRLNYPGNK
ncbi:hypothetical protein [Zooshikella ganghwensis]|uniref:hypothetical protein n=1 Tax=Zooshikella ganghwensis TaxID=202772 RepID=UPI00047F96FD|nr:hypothetical protein [Zooshikella ganghwensis]